MSDFTLNKGPLLSDFMLKIKVQFFPIVRVELRLLIHIPDLDLDQFKGGGNAPPAPPYKKNLARFCPLYPLAADNGRALHTAFATGRLILGREAATLPSNEFWVRNHTVLEHILVDFVVGHGRSRVPLSSTKFRQ